jgi:hypothetical protein
VHPIERLRYVARSSGDPSELAQEAAEALAALSGDPRALLTASRRLLDAHPECGPLWWLAARLLCAVDPARVAEESREQLSGDVTAEELASSLPGAAIVVTAPSRLVLDALSLRPDCTARLVGPPAALRPALRLLADDVAEVAGYAPSECGGALRGATVLLVEALAASPSGVLASAGSAALLRRAAASEVACWLVAGHGRVLPAALFEACATRALRGRRTGERLAPDRFGLLGLDEPAVHAGDIERVAADAFSAAVTSFGPLAPTPALAEAGCPAPAELTRSAG